MECAIIDAIGSNIPYHMSDSSRVFNNVMKLNLTVEIRFVLHTLLAQECILSCYNSNLLRCYPRFPFLFIFLRQGILKFVFLERKWSRLSWTFFWLQFHVQHTTVYFYYQLKAFSNFSWLKEIDLCDVTPR